MGKLTYGMNVSVDGYIADTNGDIGWSDPDAELHQYWNHQVRDCQRRPKIDPFSTVEN